jgi:hypothetical protein
MYEVLLFFCYYLMSTSKYVISFKRERRKNKNARAIRSQEVITQLTQRFGIGDFPRIQGATIKSVIKARRESPFTEISPSKLF